MSISVTCSGCGRRLKAGAHLSGKRVKCPNCQAAVEVPADEESPEPEPVAPVEDSAAETDQEFDWGELNLGNRKEVEDPSRPRPRPARPRRVRLTEDDDEPRLVKPRLRGEPDEETTRPAKQPRQQSRVVVRDEDPAESSWRDHLHWLFALMLLPLAVSLLTNSDQVRDEIVRAVAEHPELEQAPTKEAFFQVLPNHKLASAHLAHDSLFHWAYALAAALLFAGLLALMFPGANASLVGMVIVGAATGTVGILMLLAFQLIAGATRGVWVRGRGIGVLIFLIVKFIGFSYDCAENPENGWLLSFLGFTCGVGLCEELCKAVPIVIYLNAGKETDWKGACVMGLASGVGFGISEGIAYSSGNYNGIAPLLTYFVRFLSCVSLHAIWAASVALLMQRNQDYIDADWDWENIFWFLVHYLGIAMVLHGLYDTLLKQDYQFFALAVAAVSFGWWLWLLRRAGVDG